MRLLHISDLHLASEPGDLYPGLSDRMTNVMTVLRDAKADAVVVSGDLTESGSHDVTDLVVAREWIDALGIPWLVVPGNHDLGANRRRSLKYPDREWFDERPFAETAFAHIFGDDLAPVLSIDGVTLVGVVLREGDPDGALDALRSQLMVSSAPIVVVGHYPVIMPRDVPMIAEFGARGYVDREASALEQLMAEFPAVRLYCSGHVHLTSSAPLAHGGRQLTAGGLGPGASSFRIVDFDARRREARYSTVDAEGPQEFWERAFPGLAAIPAFSAGAPSERGGVVGW